MHQRARTTISPRDAPARRLNPIRLFRKTALAASGWLWRNGTVPGGWRDFSWPILACAVERRDTAWPGRIGAWVRGARVLDVGCGRNLQGIGFLAAGARSYTGLDPTLVLDSAVLKDSRQHWSHRIESGLSPRTLMAASPRLRYAASYLRTFAGAEAGGYDVIAMHNVTEHLPDIEDDIARFAALLRPGGRLVFRHPNFYCWHGHHQRPRTVGEIDPADPAQTAVLDWAHVRFDPERHAWIERTQNRIRLDALRTLIERHFTIERWEETESPPEQGIHRLTGDILARHPDFTRRELAVKAVFIVAARRG